MTTFAAGAGELTLAASPDQLAAAFPGPLTTLAIGDLIVTYTEHAGGGPIGSDFAVKDNGLRGRVWGNRADTRDRAFSGLPPRYLNEIVTHLADLSISPDHP